jgi:hypothetical protein
VDPAVAFTSAASLRAICSHPVGNDWSAFGESNHERISGHDLIDQRLVNVAGVRVPASLRHVDPKTRRNKRRRLRHPSGRPGERPMQEHHRWSLASHFVPGRQASNGDVTGLEALNGRNCRLAHSTLFYQPRERAPRRGGSPSTRDPGAH